VQFFRVFRFGDNGEPATPFNLRDRAGVLREIHAGSDRYLRLNDRITCVVADAEDPLHLRVLDVRRDELPQVERDGTLNDLAIPADAGLAEQTHVVGFSNGVIGTDFNFYGPRISRLADFLISKTHDQAFIRPLIKRDIAAELGRYRDVKLVHLRIDRTLIEPIREVDESLAAAFDAAFNVGQPGQVELVLRPRPYERGGIGQRILDLAHRLSRRPEIQGAGKFEIRGYLEEGGLETLDLLSEHIGFNMRIQSAGPRTRSLDHPAAYAAIQRAYVENQQEIQTAAVLGF
jgi:hypothetical protein